MLKDNVLRVHLKNDCFLDVLDVRVNFSHLKSLGNMIMLSIDYGIKMYKLNAILCSNFCDNTIISSSSKRKRYCSDLNHITKELDQKIIIRYCEKKSPSQTCLKIMKTDFKYIDYCMDNDNSYEIIFKDQKDVFKLKDTFFKKADLKHKDIKGKGFDETPTLENFYKALKCGKKLSVDQLQHSLEEELKGINEKYGFDATIYEEKCKELEILRKKIERSYFDVETELVRSANPLRREMVINMQIKEFNRGAPRYYYKYGKYIKNIEEVDFIEKVQNDEVEIGDYENDQLLDHLPYMDSDGFENIRNHMKKLSERDINDKVDYKTYAQMLKDEVEMSDQVKADRNRKTKSESSKILIDMSHKKKDQAYLEMVNQEVDMEIKMESLKKRKALKNKERKHISNYAFKRLIDKYPITDENRFKLLSDNLDSESEAESYDSEDFELEEEPKVRSAEDCDIIPTLKNYEMALNCIIQVENIEEVFCDVQKHVKQRKMKKERKDEMPLRMQGHAPEMRGKNYFGLLARLFQMMERHLTCTSVSKLYNIKGKNLKYAYGNVMRIRNLIQLDLISLNSFKLLT